MARRSNCMEFGYDVELCVIVLESVWHRFCGITFMMTVYSFVVADTTVRCTFLRWPTCMKHGKGLPDNCVVVCSAASAASRLGEQLVACFFAQLWLHFGHQIGRFGFRF